MRSTTLAALALAACGKGDAGTKSEPAPVPAEPRPAPQQPQRPQTIDKLEMAVPDGWTAKYAAEADKWLFETPPLPDGRTANARIERAAPGAVASPDAYLAQRLRSWDAGTKADIESRRSVKDGFAMTVVVRAAVDPDRPKRETYVVRQLGNVWYQCLSEWIPDDTIRDQLLALCKSLKL
jgi:glucose/arabinose dehydrogenase